MSTTIQQSKHTAKERSLQVAMPLNAEVKIGTDETVRLLHVPDHNRFWWFIEDHLCGGVAEGLFYQLVKQLEGMGEIEFANLFVDGTKEEANANRYSFVWAKSTGKHEARLDARLATELERLETEYAPFSDPKDAQTWLAYLQKLRDVQGITFARGRGKCKTGLQRDVEMLESCLARKAKYQDYNVTFKGRNSFSKTDHDATFMRMKNDPMKNGQLKPGHRPYSWA